MPRALALLVAGLAMAAPALAQFGVAPKPQVEAEAHIFSAFTSGADPRVLAERVVLGPALSEQLGADAERARIYDTLVALVAAKPLRTRSLLPAEAATHASLPGVKAAEPLVMLEAGDVQLLLQYAPSERNVAFVEQRAGATIATPTPPRAPKSAPVVEMPLPTEPPPPPPVAAPPAPVAAPAAPRAQKPPPPVVTQPAPPQPAPQPTPQRECVIKPVMSDEDLRACGARL